MITNSFTKPPTLQSMLKMSLNSPQAQAAFLSSTNQASLLIFSQTQTKLALITSQPLLKQIWYFVHFKVIK